MNTLLLAVALFLFSPPKPIQQKSTEPITYPALVQDWKLYKQACYNDSSGDFFFGYEHKEPTLDGFIKWIDQNRK